MENLFSYEILILTPNPFFCRHFQGLRERGSAPRARRVFYRMRDEKTHPAPWAINCRTLGA